MGDTNQLTGSVKSSPRNSPTSDITSQSVQAVAPPPELVAEPIDGTDTLHDLLARKREAVKNKLLYHLTEADCNLLLTGSREVSFPTGAIIAEEGHVVSSIYRIKSGRVQLFKQKRRLYELTQGYFIGEGLFIHGEYQDIFGTTLRANGPVVLSEVNLAFARNLLEVDNVLAFKIYRHIASKLSALLFAIIGTIRENAARQGITDTRVASFTLIRSSSGISPPPPGSPTSDSVSVSSTGSSESTDHPRPVITWVEEKGIGQGRIRKKVSKIKSKRISLNIAHTPYKVYNLEETTHGHVSTVELNNKKITIKSSFRLKKKIKFTKIMEVARTGPNLVTIIYDLQAKTLFFKEEADRNEFYGIVQTLLAAAHNQPITSITAETTISVVTDPVTSPVPANSEPLLPLDKACAGTKEMIQGMATRQVLKKGDVIVAEGDLYQRIYTIAEGKVNLTSHGQVHITMESGECFGLLTLFHLRPSHLTISVASDTCTLLVVPYHRIQELIHTNFPLSVRLHKKAAQLIYAQIEKLLKNSDEAIAEF